jgi:hypothetical protein
MRIPSSLPLLLLLASGCSATPGAYPSLAPRAVESIDMGAEVRPRPAAPTPVDAGLDARATALLGSVRDARSAFETALAQARPQIAAAGAPGSESWVVAQQALTRVQQARSAMVTAVAELDALRIAQAQRPPVDMTVLDAAWQEAGVLDAEQAAKLEGIGAALARP